MSDHKAHHPFSPSRLNHYRDCPGAYKMCLGLIEESSPEADEGTMLHERIATGNFEGLTTEQTALCHECAKFRASITPDGARVHTEIHVTVYDEDGSVLTEGTIDFLIENPDGSITVVDWKFGRSPVREVHRNLQLATYALGGMQKFSAPVARCYVFQPRIRATSNYVFTMPENIRNNIRRVIEAAKSVDTMVLNPGSESCKYCIGKIRCCAYRMRFTEFAENKIKAFDELTPEQLTALYEESKRAASFAAKIDKAFKGYLDANGSCCGYVYASKPGDREIRDAMRLYLRVKHLITPDEFNRLCKISVPAMIDLLVEKIQADAVVNGKKTTKVEAKAIAEKELLGDLIGRGDAKKTIVGGSEE